MPENQSTTDVMPDQLMQRFRGPGLKSMLVFTLVIHAVFILGTSLPGIVRGIVAEDTSEMTTEERAELASKEATAALREIAGRHGISPQELTNRFAGTTPARQPQPSLTTEPEPASGGGDEAARSAIEQELETTADGPTVPAIPDAEEEDLFR
jgi:hypothetical protein